jgi:hypothetical protein
MLFIHTSFMTKNQKGFSVHLMLIPSVVFVLILIAGYYVFNQDTRVSITNSGTTFSFDMGVPAKNVSHNDSQGSAQYYEVKLENYSNKVIATAYIPQKSTINADINCPSAVFKANINGAEHRVCIQKNIVYVTNFNNKDKWYQATVFSEGLKTPIKQETVTELLQSLKVE